MLTCRDCYLSCEEVRALKTQAQACFSYFLVGFVYRGPMRNHWRCTWGGRGGRGRGKAVGGAYEALESQGLLRHYGGFEFVSGTEHYERVTEDRADGGT